MHLSAITLAVADMDRSIEFYAVLGLEAVYGPTPSFTSLRLAGRGKADGAFLNLQRRPGDTGTGWSASAGTGWGRWILHVDDPDAVHAAFVAAGHQPDADPADAPWGERYFHIRDPDGHELSIARPLASD